MTAVVELEKCFGLSSAGAKLLCFGVVAVMVGAVVMSAKGSDGPPEARELLPPMTPINVPSTESVTKDPIDRTTTGSVK